jgi:PhoD-like phosphatase
MASLVLGPLLRYVSDTEATVWVETDAACEVEVLGERARTFEVAHHHYALVCIDGLEPGGVREYEVALDGETVWPAGSSDFPPSAIGTLQPHGKVDLVFGSCRLSLPHVPPYTLTKDENELGREVDALYVLGRQMLRGDRSDFPEAILMIGDQVYADEVPPNVREFIAERRANRSGEDEAPLDEVADFEEYTRLYYEAWSEPVIRWLLSTVSSSMVFDDHDMNDDWNISRSWVADMRGKPWWQERIVGGFMSYWVYQHIGNLSPRELADDETYRAVSGAMGDATPILREFAARAEREPTGTRWSTYRDIGRTRLIIVDSRASRVLEHDRRLIFDDAEWDWIVEHATGDFDHLVIGTSLPYLLGHGMHYLEAWSERVCNGAWGKAWSRVGERIRRGVDLEHWAAFEMSFERLSRLLEDVGSGRRGRPPASIVVISGDVHHAYLAEVAFRRCSGVKSAVYQAVCSPMRNPLNVRERLAIRAGASPFGFAVGRALARLAGVPDPQVRWRFVEGPLFNNQIATLKLRGRDASLRLDKTAPQDDDGHRLDQIFDRPLAGKAPR